MAKPRAGRKLPAQISFPDFRRKLEHFGYSVTRCGSGEYKATGLDQRGQKDSFFFATIRGRHVKREYIRQAINRLGVTREEFVKA